MAIGTVKWFDQARGYGFVTDDLGEDFFISAKDAGTAWTALVKGARVQFTISIQRPRTGECRRAVDVQSATT